MRATSTVWSSPWAMPWHSHGEARLVVVLRGSFQEHWKANVLECSDGSAIFRPEGQLHREAFSRQGSYVSIPLSTAELSEPFCSRSDRIAALGHALQRELRYADRFTSLSVEGLALQILAELGRSHATKERRAPSWIAELCEYIRSNPTQAGSLASLAGIAGRHPAHVARAFHEHVGMTLGEFARMQRVQFARKLLETSDARVSQIAARAGFFDQAHFSRSFRAIFGVSPSEYRRSRRR